MKLTVDRDHLKAALARTKPAVGRNHLPILTGVRIDPRLATLTTTNLDLVITAELDTDGTGQPIIVPHERFAALVARCPDGTITLEADEERLTIAAGRTNAHLRLLPLDEWPVAPEIGGDAHKLTDDWASIRRVLHARPVGDAAKLHLNQVRLADHRAFALDNYRLAEAPIESDLEVLLPGPLVVAVGDAADVTLLHDRDWVQLTADGTTYAGRPLVGEYPPPSSTDKLVKLERPIAIEVERDELIDAVATIATLGPGIGSGVPSVRLDHHDGLVTASAHRVEVGDATIELDAHAEGPIPDGFAVMFNCAYLTDALRAHIGTHVTLRGIDELKTWGLADDGLVQALMPMRIGK